MRATYSISQAPEEPPKAKKISALRIAFSCACILTGGRMGWDIGNYVAEPFLAQIQNLTLQTPEEYMDSKGETLTDKQREILREMDNVRVVEKGGRSSKIFCTLNASTCEKYVAWDSAQYLAPPAEGRGAKRPPVIIVTEVRKSLADLITVAATGKKAKMGKYGPYQDAIIDRFVFFHEIGHAFYDKNMPELKKTLSPIEFERVADIFALKSFNPIEKYVAGQYWLALRSVHVGDAQHDTSIQLQDYLAGTPATDVKLVDASREAFLGWANNCFTADPEATQGANFTYDFIRNCQLALPVSTDTRVDALVARRQRNFNISYDALFTG